MEDAYFEFSGQLTLDELKRSVECLEFLGDYIQELFDKGELQGYIEKTLFYKGLMFTFYLQNEEIESVSFQGTYALSDLKNHEKNSDLDSQLVNWKELSDNLLDRAVEFYGNDESIYYLLEMGYNINQLVNVLGFGEDDVIRIVEEKREEEKNEPLFAL